MIKNNNFSFFKSWWFLVLFLIFYFLASNILVILRYKQFEVFYFDHGLYDQALWNASKLELPLIDHLGSKYLNQLGDHFSPVMYLIILIYWLFPGYLTLFVMGNILIITSAWVLFLLARLKIKSKLMVSAVVIAYLMFVGMQNAILFAFHPIQIAVLTLMLMFYFFEKKNWKGFWISFILSLLVKETLVSIFIGFGIYLFLRKFYKKSLVMIVGTLIYYYVIVFHLMPLINNSQYFYHAQFYSLPEMVSQFFYPWIKSKTMFYSFASFGFLPILNITFLPTIIQNYFLRFVLNRSSVRWDLGLHYNAVISVLMAYSSILAVSFLNRVKWYKKFIGFHACIIILFVFVYHQFIYHGPLGLTYNKVFYTRTKDFEFLNNLIKKANIKKDDLVMTGNNIAPHLTHDCRVILFREKYWEWMPDKVLMDKRGGQDINNHFPLNRIAFQTMIESLDTDPNYTKIAVAEDQWIFLKKQKTDMDLYTKTN
jgi:uncharacterized membrane protein